MMIVAAIVTIAIAGCVGMWLEVQWLTRLANKRLRWW